MANNRYSAKTVFFHKDGDQYFQAIRVPVTKAKYRNMDSLLDDLSGKVPLYFGVRKVFTPSGHTEVHSLDQLVNHGRYVCSSSSKPQGLKIRSVHSKSHAGKNSSSEGQSSEGARSVKMTGNSLSEVESSKSTKRKIETGFEQGPVSKTIKKIEFILNCAPNRRHVMHFKNNRLMDLNYVLQELTHTFEVPVAKLFTLKGVRVTNVQEAFQRTSQFLACKQHERPHTVDVKKLPPIDSEPRWQSVSPQTRKSSSVSKLPFLEKPRRGARKSHWCKNSSVPSKSRAKINDEVKKPTAIDVPPLVSHEVPDNAFTSKQPIGTDVAVNGKISEGSSVPSQQEASAAVKIQAGYRGFKARQTIKKEKEAKAAIANVAVSESPGESSLLSNTQTVTSSNITSTVNDTEIGEEISNLNDEECPKSQLECVYKVVVFTGNRWAADCDADLYVVLCGTMGKSEKQWLKQDSTLSKFKQNQADTYEIHYPYVGELKSVIVGHESQGYGSGIYIDRLVVYEVSVDSYYYAFLCSKWLDTGQVDGEIERELPCAGYYHIEPALNRMNESGTLNRAKNEESRWNVTVNVGVSVINEVAKRKLHITVYGSRSKVHSDFVHETESFAIAADDHSQTIAFVNVGDIYKVRLETAVVLQDNVSEVAVESLDLENKVSSEKFHSNTINVVNGDVRQMCQIFKEYPVIDPKYDPLPVYVYHGCITFGTFRSIPPNHKLKLQILGEFGESGVISVNCNNTKEMEYQDTEFFVECVCLGRLISVIVSAPVDEQGESVYEGFQVLENLYEKYNLPVSSAHDWLVKKIVIRESLHTPYQFVFEQSKTLEKKLSGILRKEIVLTDINGLETKKADGCEGTDLSKENWLFCICPHEEPEITTQHGPLSVVLYGTLGKTESIILQDTSTTQTIRGYSAVYEVSFYNVGSIYKLRLEIPESGSDDSVWYIRKLKMVNLETLQSFIVSAEMILTKAKRSPQPLAELAVVWPDVPPLSIVTYQIAFHTAPESSYELNFGVYIILYGEKGDTGRRIVNPKEHLGKGELFIAGKVSSFEIEAVYLQNISMLTVGAESDDDAFEWQLQHVDIVDPEAEMLFVFQCHSKFARKERNMEIIYTDPVVKER